MARVHKQIGSKERLFEMFENVNKTKIVESKEEKPILKEGYNEWGQKIKKSRINESFDNPEEKDHKYLNKDYDNVQDGKPDDGVRYPVEEPLKTDAPELEQLKGDDAPIEKPSDEPTLDQIPESDDTENIEADDADNVALPGQNDPETGEPIRADDPVPFPGSGEHEELEGGLADGKEPMEFDPHQIAMGIEVEMEHTDDPQKALEIAMDHLVEIPDYYNRLEDMEAEAKGEGATGEDVVDAMGDGQEGEAAEEIPDPEEDTEKEMLWGKLDTVGDDDADDVFDNYSPKGLEEGEKKKKDSRLEKAGVEGYNKPKETPDHPTKSHIVVAKEGDKIKTIRFGQQGVSGAGDDPKSEEQKDRQRSFKARHAKNIKKGKMSAAYWADRVKWVVVLLWTLC